MNTLARSSVLRDGHSWLKSNSALLKKIYIVAAVVLTIAYPLLTLLPSPPATVLKTYGLTQSSYYLVILPIVILLMLIFLAGFYGSLTLKKYSSLIRGSRDGRAMNMISNGLLVLAMSMPVTSVVSAISSLIERNHLSTIEWLSIFNNYLALILMGISFMLITIGSEYLYDLVRDKITPWPQKIWVFAFIVFSCLYTYFIVFQASQPGIKQNTYSLPHWLLLITLVIPYLYIWYRGINAGYCMFEYRLNVNGKVYKSAISFLSGGIVLVIIGSIATRTITTLSSKLTSLHLTPLLVLIYALLALIGAGYLLIAAAARRLRKIEEV